MLTLQEAKTAQTQPGFNLASAAQAATLPNSNTTPTATSPTITSTPTTQAANSTAPAPISNSVNTSQPSPTTVSATPYTQSDTSGLIGTRPSAANPSVNEYYNTQTGAGFATPQALSTFVNQQGGNTNAQNVFDALKTSFSKLMASNTPSPQSQGEAKSLIDANTPATQQGTNPLSAIFDMGQQSPEYQQLMTDYKQAISVLNQQKSLTQTYQDMSKELGIQSLDTQLMDMKKVIDGTEDDLRTEITKAGGYATESQIQALTNARNKQLITNYNNLVQTRNQAQQTLTTMMGLAEADRQNLNAQIDRQLNFDQQMLQYRNQMQTNAQNQLSKVVEAVGYGGLLQMTGGNPYYTSLVEKTLGLAPGGLQSLANYKKPLTEAEQLDIDIKKQQLENDRAMLPLDKRLKEMQIKNIQSEIANRGNTTSLFGNIKATPTDIRVAQIIANNPGQWGNAADQIDKEFGSGTATKYDSWLKSVYQNGQSVNTLQPLGQAGTGNTPVVLAKSQDFANTLASLRDQAIPVTKGGQGAYNAVGPNAISRANVKNFFNSEKDNYIAKVQSLVDQLTLDNLIKAKDQGATFGALSEGELSLLANSATTINKWAIKDVNGKVTGYKTNLTDFNKELDKIYRYAQMDYILKGGNPNDVGVEVMPDGKFMTKNSDGTFTEF